jgi:hypothetical protein
VTRSVIVVGRVLGTMLSIVSVRWGAEADARVMSFTVSNPECTAVDLTANRCAINLRSLSIIDDGAMSPFLTWAQVSIDGHVRLRLTAFFEKSIYYSSGMTPQGLRVPCGLPNESGLGAAIGKMYPVTLEPLDQSGTSMGTDVANVLCPAAVTTTTSTTTSSSSTSSTTSSTTTSSTTTSSTRPPTTTTTTLPCTDARCILEAALMSAACEGQTIPGGVTSELTRAEHLIDRAATASRRKARRLRHKAKVTLRRARARAARAAKRKKRSISAACAAALRDSVDRVAAGL